MKIQPILFSLYWFLGAIASSIVFGLIADSGASGGEQKLFTYVAYSIAFGLLGIGVINVAFLVLNKSKDFRKKWISICLAAFSVVCLYPLSKGIIFSSYDEAEDTLYQGADRIDIKFEYYPSIDTVRLLRSQSIWRNGMRDSIWITYARDGAILKKQHFKNGKLIRTSQQSKPPGQ
jgi:hypothetical protein